MDSELSNLEVDREGVRPVITKRATGPECDRLVHEVAMLRAARHPGVVSLVDDEAIETSAVGVDKLGSPISNCQLRMFFVGSRTLANLGRIEPERAAALVAAVASTVADLHEAGLAHSRLSADHVIVASDGRPVLCGFAEAYFIQSVSDGASDVASLGQLLYDLVASTEASFEFPERHQRRGSTRQSLRAPLLNLAEQAMATDPRRRPTARQFCDLIQATVPEASLSSSEAKETRVKPTGALIAMIAGVCCIAAAAGMVLWGNSSPSNPPPPEVLALGINPPLRPPTNPTITSLATENQDTDQVPVASNEFADAMGCSLQPNGMVTAANGQACLAEVRLSESTLYINELAFDFKETNLAVAIGDFTCESTVTPAVANLTSGYVYVFDSWATESSQATARPVAQVDAIRQLLAEPTNNGCNQLVALDEWGIRHVLETTPEGA